MEPFYLNVYQSRMAFPDIMQRSVFAWSDTIQYPTRAAADEAQARRGRSYCPRVYVVKVTPKPQPKWER